MGIDDFFYAMLGLFIFFVCPWLIFRYIGKKINQWSENRKIEKRKREENEVIIKYENIIQNGVELYNMGRYILEKSQLFYFGEEDPYIISRGRSIMICLPIEDSHIQDFERIYRHFYEEKGDKDIYNGKDITEHFYVEKISDCENEYGSVVDHYNSSFVAPIGQVQRNEEWTCGWEKGVVIQEVLKRAGVIK